MFFGGGHREHSLVSPMGNIKTSFTIGFFAMLLAAYLDGIQGVFKVRQHLAAADLRYSHVSFTDIPT